MAAPVPVVASDWLRPRLGADWRTGRVVGVTPRAAYVVVDVRDASDGGVLRAAPPRVLAIETSDAVGLPDGVEVADPDVLARIVPGQAVTLDGTGVSAGTWGLAVHRWRRSRPVPGPAGAAVVRERLRSLGATPDRPLPRAWPEPDRRLATGVATLAAVVAGGGTPGSRDEVFLDEVLDGLVGYGPGSTPAGDDVVAAVVATATVLVDRWGRSPTGPATLAGRVAAIAPGRTTALSATLLACAVDGAMARPAAAALVALTAPPDPAPDRRPGGDPGVADAFECLAAVGHTSGRDLALGMLATVSALVADRARAGATRPGHDGAGDLLPSTSHDRSS